MSHIFLHMTKLLYFKQDYLKDIAKHRNFQIENNLVYSPSNYNLRFGIRHMMGSKQSSLDNQESNNIHFHIQLRSIHSFPKLYKSK